MSYAHIIKEIGRGAEGSRDMLPEEAEFLYGAMIDGQVPDLELGAILIALRMKVESSQEMLGFLRAANARIRGLHIRPDGPRPVIIPSYNGARKSANLTPLLALLLQRHGVPVVVHGLIEGYGRVTSGHIFSRLGIEPAATPQQAQQKLDQQGLVIAPLPVLLPGLANLLTLRTRMGVRNSAHSLVKMLDPCTGYGVLLAAATHPAYIDSMRDVLGKQQPTRALLSRATEGEPFANPKRRPCMEFLCNGEARVLFEADHDSLKSLPHLPGAADAESTAAWIREVLDNRIPVPQPIAWQLAACLYASGKADDFDQAKSMAGVNGDVLLTEAGRVSP